MLSFLPIIATAALAEAGGPLDQLTGQFGVNIPSLLAQVLNFGILAFLLYRFAVRPILANLDERQEKISSGLQYAEEMKLKLAEAERHCAQIIKTASLEAQSIIEEARSAAKAHLEHQIQEAAHLTEEMIKKAQEVILQERQKMLQEVRTEVSALVIKTTAAVLSRELSSAERTSFAEAAIRELAS